MAVADEQDDVFDEKLDFIDCARYGEIDEVTAKLNANKTLAMSVDDRKNNGVLFIWSYIAFTCPLCFHLVFFVALIMFSFTHGKRQWAQRDC